MEYRREFKDVSIFVPLKDLVDGIVALRLVHRSFPVLYLRPTYRLLEGTSGSFKD